MPIYEYLAEDGTKLELLRSMSDADKPVEDPEAKGREFKRMHSTFATAGGPGPAHMHSGSSCPCGKKPGSCGS